MKSGFVTIIGRPNAGKSTLLNAMIGQKISIVSEQSQTTRHAIQGILHHPDYQIVFVDTPGIHKPKARLGERMNAQAFGSLEGVDVVLYVIDANEVFGKGDHYLIERLATEKNIIVVMNKIDLIKVEKMVHLKTIYQNLLPQAKIVEVSAIKRALIDDLIKTIIPFLSGNTPYFPPSMITNVNEPFQLAEWIRERVLAHTYEEVPHSVAVAIDAIEADGLKRKVIASIIVEKPSQKGILIGEKGSKIRKIRLETTRTLFKDFGLEVQLELFVRVEKNWRDSLDRLKEFGIS
jgi:GTP-binding protein Era